MAGGLLEGASGAYLGVALLFLLAGLAVGAALMRRSQRRRDEQFREAQAALRASEDRLRWAVEVTSEIVWDWDLVTDAIYHPSWAQTYGFPEERTPRTGKDLGPFIHPDDWPRFHAEVSKVAGGPHDTFEIEHRALAGSGEWRWMNGRGRVVARDAGGKATRIVGTCTDVTERKRMLARLQIGDRMASIGTLAAGVAHEINNPLSYVLGNLSFSLEQLDPLLEPDVGGHGPADVLEAVRACLPALREAEAGAGRVRDIVRDMKLFSRADEEPRVPVQVGSVLHGALALARNEIRHRAQVVVEVDDVPPVLANESRLAQVFLNLLVNAAQSIPEGHADRNAIRVDARRGEAGGAVVEVRDTGCGISPENRKRLFDPFFTTKPMGSGTGLGLSICHGIVTSLGGEIEVESELGKGSTFRVTLPAAANVATGREVERPRVAPPRRARRRARILLVDDELLFCRMVERALGAEHDIVAVTDAREALRRVRAGERYDALVTDLAMPVLSGMELHDEIARADPGLANRTLFATGGAFTPLAAEFVARHSDRVLLKPVPAAALRAAVAAVLEHVPLALVAPVAR